LIADFENCNTPRLCDFFILFVLDLVNNYLIFCFSASLSISSCVIFSLFQVC